MDVFFKFQNLFENINLYQRKRFILAVRNALSFDDLWSIIGFFIQRMYNDKPIGSLLLPFKSKVYQVIAESIFYSSSESLDGGNLQSFYSNMEMKQAYDQLTEIAREEVHIRIVYGLPGDFLIHLLYDSYFHLFKIQLRVPPQMRTIHNILAQHYAKDVYAAENALIKVILFVIPFVESNLFNLSLVCHRMFDKLHSIDKRYGRYYQHIVVHRAIVPARELRRSSMLNLPQSILVHLICPLLAMDMMQLSLSCKRFYRCIHGPLRLRQISLLRSPFNRQINFDNFRFVSEMYLHVIHFINFICIFNQGTVCVFDRLRKLHIFGERCNYVNHMANFLGKMPIMPAVVCLNLIHFENILEYVTKYEKLFRIRNYE